jgi:F-type H+-transporting ATPase subunit gamma
MLADFTVSDRVNFNEVKPVVAEFMVKQYLDGVIDTVEIIYPRFRNTLVQEPTLRPLLPLTNVRDVHQTLRADAGIGGQLVDKRDMLFEPDAQRCSTRCSLLRQPRRLPAHASPPRPRSTARAWSP